MSEAVDMDTSPDEAKHASDASLGGAIMGT